jgi:type I restriction enzyme M protein
MTEIAWLADVKLPTVSNWRRRHESFPESERRDGREYFLVDEVANWLDNRKISKGDLKKGELPGATYGVRVHRKQRQVTPSAEQKEALWKVLNRLHGAEDIAVYADLVLGLLYLFARERDQWSDMLTADNQEMVQLLELAILAQGELFSSVHRSWRSVLNDSRGKERLAETIRAIDQVEQWTAHKEDARSPQWAGEVFEYLLSRFVAAEGKRGAVVVTPPSVVRVLVELIALKPGESLLDPCSDSGGFLLGTAKYLAAHGSRTSSADLAGQAILRRSWSLGRMNLALHDVRADLAARPGIALHDDLHAGKRFDAVLANPPFNMSDIADYQPTDGRWRFGLPPKSNANFAWLQHIWSSLAEDGRAAVVMANGALSSEQAGEGRIRAAMVEGGVVEALIALPAQLFPTTAIPVTVWLLRRPREARNDEILFIDARELGSMISRSQRDLSSDEIRRIADTVVAWRKRDDQDGYQDVQGFSASVGIEGVRKHDYQLTPGRYVGARISTHTPENKVPELRRELARLSLRAEAAEAAVKREFDKIAADKRDSRREFLLDSVPDNWRRVSLGEVCEILIGPSGTRLALQARTSSNIPVVAPRDLRNNKIADDAVAAVTPEIAAELARYRLKEGDVVCSRTGDLGRQAMASERQHGWLIGSACLRLRTTGSISPSYLLNYLAHPAVRDWIVRNATGSVIASLNTKTLSSMPLVLPPIEVQSAATDILSALDEKIDAYEQISKAAVVLRESLLPHLLTGPQESGRP